MVLLVGSYRSRAKAFVLIIAMLRTKSCGPKKVQARPSSSHPPLAGPRSGWPVRVAASVRDMGMRGSVGGKVQVAIPLPPQDPGKEFGENREADGPSPGGRGCVVSAEGAVS